MSTRPIPFAPATCARSSYITPLFLCEIGSGFSSGTDILTVTDASCKAMCWEPFCGTDQCHLTAIEDPFSTPIALTMMPQTLLIN